MIEEKPAPPSSPSPQPAELCPFCGHSSAGIDGKCSEPGYGPAVDEPSPPISRRFDDDPCQCVCHKVGLFGFMCCRCTREAIREYAESGGYHGFVRSPMSPVPQQSMEVGREGREPDQSGDRVPGLRDATDAPTGASGIVPSEAELRGEDEPSREALPVVQLDLRDRATDYWRRYSSGQTGDENLIDALMGFAKEHEKFLEWQARGEGKV